VLFGIEPVIEGPAHRPGTGQRFDTGDHEGLRRMEARI